MFKKFCASAIEVINVSVGAISLTAIAIGAATVFGSSGLFCLNKAGVETIPEKRIEQTLNLGMSSIYFGAFGLLFGATTTCVAHVLDRDDEEESSTSISTNSLVNESRESILSEDNTELPYLYLIMRLNGYSQFGDDLIIGRLEDGIFVHEFVNSHCKDGFLDVFDCFYDENELIGKAFSSINPKPLDAARELIDFYRPQIEANREGSLAINFEACGGCRNFHGADNIVCGIHPYGWDNSTCPDWESKNNQKQVHFPFEREEVVEHLSQRIEVNQARLIKHDNGTLTLWDYYTNRYFRFSWAGILLDDSDKLVELGEHARLLSYVQYFSVRAVIEFDYSSKIDEFAKQLKGIASVEISDTGINVRVKHCPMRNHERIFRFQLNGIPLYPYESIVPQQIKSNYNLVTFVEWLKDNKTRTRR